MADAEFPHFGSVGAEQLLALSTHTVQLLSMMEVVQMSMAQDATYLVETSDAMEAFAARMEKTGLKLPLDPGGRSRECLRVSADKAQLLHLQMDGMAAQDDESVHALVAGSLHRLALVCQRLLTAVRKHEQPFERAGAAPPLPGP